jgi:hypothetical protein
MHPSLANALPALPIALPLLAASALAGLRKQLPRPAADCIVILTSAINLALTLTLLREAQVRTIVYWFGNWHPRGSMVLGITFVIDPVSAGLAVLAATLTLLALLFSWRFVDAGANHFQPLMLVFLTGITGFSCPRKTRDSNPMPAGSMTHSRTIQRIECQTRRRDGRGCAQSCSLPPSRTLVASRNFMREIASITIRGSATAPTVI